MQKLISAFTTGANGTITISSIPQTYKSLRVIVQGTPVGSAYDLLLRFNNTTTTSITRTNIRLTGATTDVIAPTTATSPMIWRIGYEADTQIDLRIGNYSQTDKWTTVQGFNTQSSGGIQIRIMGDVYPSNNAVTSLVFANTWTAGTRVLLYGVE